jgi:hypothetical protein
MVSASSGLACEVQAQDRYENEGYIDDDEDHDEIDAATRRQLDARLNQVNTILVFSQFINIVNILHKTSIIILIFISHVKGGETERMKCHPLRHCLLPVVCVLLCPGCVN